MRDEDIHIGDVLRIRQWCDLSDEDWDSNERAYVNNDDRLFSAYIDKKTNIKIWIITEYDRTVTTILFPSEY